MTLDGGFEAGKTYQIAYRAANPPVAGLGFVAMRDFVAWLKHQPDAVATVRHAYAFGASQSGRYLATFCTRASTPTSATARCSTA